MKTMNKAELTKVVTGKIEGATQKQAGEFVDAIFDAIAEALANGESVNIPGFGKFEVRKRSARSGVNPLKLKELKEQGVDAATAKEQAAIQIEASQTPAFKAARALKEAVK
jgi:DNA-binding protein HU-beta